MLSINKTMEGIMAENNIGKITQVIGAVIDIKFTDGISARNQFGHQY